MKKSSSQASNPKPACAAAAKQAAGKRPKAGHMPMWVFIVAALIMAGIAFMVIYLSHPPTKAVDLPSPQVGQNSGKLVFPQVGEPALKSGYYEGDANSGTVFVEYSDFQCPYCGRAEAALAQVKENYPSMQFAFRNFPLSAHPNAPKAAEAAECAGIQGKFWQMHDIMFANQEDLAVSSLKKYAASLGLDTAAFNSCLGSGQTAPLVAAEKAEGQGLGIGGTPGFLVYTRKGASAAVEQKLMNISSRFQSLGVSSAVVGVKGAGDGLVFAGAMPYSDYKSVIDAFSN